MGLRERLKLKLGSERKMDEWASQRLGGSSEDIKLKLTEERLSQEEALAQRKLGIAERESKLKTLKERAETLNPPRWKSIGRGVLKQTRSFGRGVAGTKIEGVGRRGTITTGQPYGRRRVVVKRRGRGRGYVRQGPQLYPQQQPPLAGTPVPWEAQRAMQGAKADRRPPAASIALMPDMGMYGHEMTDAGMPDISIPLEFGLGGVGEKATFGQRKQSRRKGKKEKDFLSDFF